MEWFNTLRRRFYAGPGYVGISPIRTRGYQSPTLTALLWLYAWSVRMFTVSGRILLMCAGVMILYSMTSLQMPVYVLAILVVGVFVVDALMGWVLRPRVDVLRELPGRVAAGGVATVSYRVRNPGRRRVHSLVVDAYLWPKGVNFRGRRPLIECIEPGGSISVRGEFEGVRRGRYTLPVCRVDTTLPFHLTRNGSQGCERQSVLVVPSFHPLVRLDVPGARQYQPGGISLSSNVAEALEFFGCREYRDGDNPRHLHWRSWARTGTPVVKEFREEYFSRTAVILDTRRVRRWWKRLGGDFRTPDPVFEAGVALTAAIGDFLDDRDFVVDLFAAGDEVYRFQGGRHLSYIDDMLDILACLNPCNDESLDRLEPEVMSEIANISSAVVVLMNWDGRREALLSELTQMGTHVRALLVCESVDLEVDLPPFVEVVAAADVMEGRCVRL
jgi:uncharacterized protein (DUF58 family)